MGSFLKRLAASGAAYQASSLVAGFLALFTLPLYTRHLTRAELGYAETLPTAIILVSILLRFGVGEAFLRLWFDDEDAALRAVLQRLLADPAARERLAAGALRAAKDRYGWGAIARRHLGLYARLAA